MPETLDGTYEQSLRRIDKQKRDFACRLFQCLVVSKRPLRVEELAELFAIQPDVDTIPAFDARCRPENPEEFILSACSTLVVVVNNRGPKIVQFSHFSVREYLTSDRIAISEHVSRFHVLPRPANALLARACMSVLLQLDDRVVRDEIHDIPLALYAAQYWVDHAQFENVSSGIQNGIKDLFDKDKPHFAAWLRLYNLDEPYPSPTSHRAQPAAQRSAVPSPLYYAALCGFRDITDHLVNALPQDVNARGGERVTPLHAALDMGHLSTAMLLLRRGADMESRDFANRTPLHMASYRGHAEVVSWLIDCGVNLSAESDDRETPLYLASKYGRQDAARLLLEHSADPNYQNAEGLTPLRAAWQGGHIDNVCLLLHHGADAKSPDNRGNPPLHVLVQEGYCSNRSRLDFASPPSPEFLKHRLDIATLLLEHGADANFSDNSGQTLLHITLRWGVVEKSTGDLIDIVRLLLNHGADANYPDIHGRTPLYIATHGGFIDIVRLLLNHGADANYLDIYGKNSLHVALQRGSIDIVRLLLNHGADANYVDKYGKNPLHVALHMGADKIIRLLIDLPGINSWTSLHAASQKGQDDIVVSLLNHGVDANHSDSNGRSPLHAASREGHVNVVRLLLDHGAAADHPDRDGWTPLHAASQKGHDGIVRLLLDHGAAPNQRDNRGRTPLHVAWKKSNNRHHSPYLLLRPDAGANSPGSDGWALLRRVSKRGNNNIVQLLLKHGADANQADNDGLTPLHLALRAGTATTSTSYYSVTAQR